MSLPQRYPNAAHAHSSSIVHTWPQFAYIARTAVQQAGRQAASSQQPLAWRACELRLVAQVNDATAAGELLTHADCCSRETYVANLPHKRRFPIYQRSVFFKALNRIVRVIAEGLFLDDK